MAQNTQSRIDAARKAGLSDAEILQGMKDSPRYKNSFDNARKAGLSDNQIAQDLGLNIQQPRDLGALPIIEITAQPDKPFRPYDWKTEQNKAKREQARNAGPTKKWESALSGFSRLGAGITQGALYAKDALFGGNSYDKFTKERADINEFQRMRRQEHDQGFDFVDMAASMVGEAPLGALGKGFQGAKILSGQGAKILGRNAAVGAGIGGTGFAEDAGQRTANTVLGGIGGGAGAAAGEKIGRGVGGIVNNAKVTANQVKNSAQFNAEIDAKLTSMLQSQGISIDDLSASVRETLRKNAIKAEKAGKNIDKDAAARAALLESLGIKGTKGQITRDPIQWQREAELAKIDGAGDKLREKFVDDNAKLKGLMDDVAGGTGGTAPNNYVAMQNALDTTRDKLAQNKEYVDSLYAMARNADGNDVPLDAVGFANDAITALERDYAMSSLPPSLQRLINDVGANPNQFTLGKSEELIKILNREYKASLQNGQPTNSTHAIGLVRDALNTRQGEAIEGLLATGGNDAALLYSSARQAHKQSRELIDSMPLLKDASKSGDKFVEPDQLFNKHILGGKVNEIDRTMQFLRNNNPQAADDIRLQVVEHIMGKSFNNNGQPSPAAMKKALEGLGDPKLNAIFTEAEVRQLKNIERAMQYLIAQPPHSAVNNSNSGSAVINAAKNFLSGLSEIPGAKYVIAPARAVANGREASQAINPTLGTTPKPQTQLQQSVYERLVQAGLLSGANALTD